MIVPFVSVVNHFYNLFDHFMFKFKINMFALEHFFFNVIVVWVKIFCFLEYNNMYKYQ